MTPPRVIGPRPFGHLEDGRAVEAWTIENGRGMSLTVLSLGGIVQALHVPDPNGSSADVVLGFNQLDDYWAHRSVYFGALVGRIAGRVLGGQLRIDGRSVSLPLNRPPHHLHGGSVGFNQRVWAIAPLPSTHTAAGVQLRYRSPAGEEGYPGTLDVAIRYWITTDHTFVVESEVVTDEPTAVSLTQHSYFNLGGEGSGTVLDHHLQIPASHYVPVDASLTPSGRSTPVDGTPCDLRALQRLDEAVPRLFREHGDLYLLGPAHGDDLRVAARLRHPATGRTLAVATNEPCLQFYTGMGLDGRATGKSGRTYGRFAGLCLECEGYPDGTQYPHLGDIMVYPDRPQRRRTEYRFGATST